MRIAQVIFDFSLGGIQKGGCALAESMAKVGHESAVIGRGGPRYRASTPSGLHHVLTADSSPQAIVEALRQFAPDVVHIHSSHYAPALLRAVSAEMPNALLISTPVFGRHPDDPEIFNLTRTCLVGCYVFYRFSKWGRITPSEAIARGIGYVPITPFEPPSHNYSTLDDPALIRARRAEFELAGSAFVIGRIGRKHVSKWYVDHERLINALLASDERLQWLSIGYPDELGRQRLIDRWGSRFRDLPETPDYDLIAKVLSCLDVQLFFGQGECFASSIAEAAGMGVPNIALVTPLRDNGQAEQVIDGQTGYLVGTINQACAHVRALVDDPAKLAAMKRDCQAFCLQRWSSDRVAVDLLSLYDGWRNGTVEKFEYAKLMIDEVNRFGSNYRKRMVDLLAQRNPIKRAKWNVALAAVENPALFQVGKSIRKIIHWRKYRGLKEAAKR